MLSAKYAYQAEHERSDSLSALLFRGSGRESPRARVRSGSRRTLGSYHETHKGAMPKTNRIASSGVGRNLESVQGYLHETLVPHEHTYKCENIQVTVE